MAQPARKSSTQTYFSWLPPFDVPTLGPNEERFEDLYPLEQ